MLFYADQRQIHPGSSGEGKEQRLRWVGKKRINGAFRRKFDLATICPFFATRPHPDLAGRIASVPYDVVDRREAHRLAADNPHSFLHVVRAEIDFPESTSPYDDKVYAKAKTNFNNLIENGQLIRDADNTVYLYRQIMGNHAQIGLVACCLVDEYDSDLIKKHEKTRKDKEDDRTRHTLEIQANAGPVFLTYRGDPEIDRLVSDIVSKQKPLYDVTTPDKVQHTVWKVQAPQAFVTAFAPVPALYVADGHHRSASASRARAALREQNSQHTGQENYNRFLAVMFPADQLSILPYNRVVHDLNGLDSQAFLARVAIVMDVQEGAKASPLSRGEYSMFLNDRWYQLKAPRRLVEANDPVERLDAAILQSQILDPLLGIDDPRTSDRIDFVGGIRGTEELEKRVRSKPGAVAFSLFPTSVDELIAVADAGLVLPPKSTWFEPKLRSGLLVHELREFDRS